MKPEETRSSPTSSMPRNEDARAMDSIEKALAGISDSMRRDAMGELDARGRMREARSARSGKAALIKGDEPSDLELSDSMMREAEDRALSLRRFTTIADPA